MKKQKVVVLNDCNTRKFSNKLSPEAGVTLIEMMITTAIGLLVSAGIATVFVFSMQQMNLLIEENETETSVLSNAFYLQKFLSQATQIQVVNAIAVPPVAPQFNPGDGQFLYNFDSHNYDTGTNAYSPIAVFNQEKGDPTGLGGALPGSSLYPTGLFLRDPDVTIAGAGNNPGETDPNRRSYNLFFNFIPTGGPLTPVTVVPNQGGVFLDRIHRLRVQTVAPCVYPQVDTVTGVPIANGVAAQGYAVEAVVENTTTAFPSVASARNGTLLSCLPIYNTPGSWGTGAGYGAEKYWIKTVTFELTGRYFKNIDRTTWNYAWEGAGVANPVFPADGTADAAPAIPMPAYRDVTQTVKINFRNNTLTTQSLTGGAGTEQRVNGSLYFYEVYVPMAKTSNF